MLYLFLTFVPVAFAAVIGQGSIDPKVNKAVDSILLIVQNELHHTVNEAVFSVATTDVDLIAEVEEVKAKVEEAQRESKVKQVNQDNSDDNESSLKKRWYGYGYPYYGMGWGGMYGMYGMYGMGMYGWGGMYGWPYYGGWGGWYFKVRKDLKQTIEGKIIKGFKAVALQIVNTEYSKFLNDKDDEAHLDATQERLAFAWEKYASYHQKNAAISQWISALEEKLSGTSSGEKTKELNVILKNSLFNVTDVFSSDQMDLPLSNLYYPSESADAIDYV